MTAVVTVIERSWVSVAEAESITIAVKFDIPVAEGVPEI